MEQTTGLWRHRNFRLLWAAQSISAIGARVTRGAVPLTAILVLQAQPQDLSLLAALAGLPAIFIGPLAGVLADRSSRRGLMIAADFSRFAALLTIPVAALIGWLSMLQLILVLAVTRSLTVLFEVADRALLPQLIRPDQLIDGNAKQSTTEAVAEIGGPVLGGVLVQLLTAPVAIFIDALSYLCSAALLARIDRAASAAAIEPEPPLAAALAGIRAVFRHPVLRPVALCFGTQAFFGNFFEGTYDYYAIRVLGLSPALLGLTIAAGGIGSLLGAALAPYFDRRFPIGRLLIGLRLGSGLFQLLIPFAGGTVAEATLMLMAAQLIGDAAFTAFMIGEISLRQRIVPDRLLGRVNASLGLIGGLAGPAGALAAGTVSAGLGVRVTLTVAALGLAASSLWLVTSRAIRTLRNPADATAAT
jgi:predicted MFS family arabinose efflux permease